MKLQIGYGSIVAGVLVKAKSELWSAVKGDQPAFTGEQSKISFISKKITAVAVILEMDMKCSHLAGICDPVCKATAIFGKQGGG